MDIRSCRTTLGNTGFFICNHTIKCNKSRYSQAAMGDILNGLVICLPSKFVSQHILHLGFARTSASRMALHRVYSGSPAGQRTFPAWLLLQAPWWCPDWPCCCLLEQADPWPRRK